MKRFLSLFLASILLVTSCHPTPTPVTPPAPTGDAAVVTPSGWTSTAQTVLQTLVWAIPAAQVVVDAIIPASAVADVNRVLAGVTDAAGQLQTALSAYLSRGGSQCPAYAAVGGVTTALVALAQTLADNGIALGNTLVPIVQDLGAVADTLVPACSPEAGYASAGAGVMAQIAAINANAAAHGVTLRPALDNLHPLAGHR